MARDCPPKSRALPTPFSENWQVLPRTPPPRRLPSPDVPKIEPVPDPPKGPPIVVKKEEVDLTDLESPPGGELRKMEIEGALSPAVMGFWRRGEWEPRVTPPSVEKKVKGGNDRVMVTPSRKGVEAGNSGVMDGDKLEELGKVIERLEVKDINDFKEPELDIPKEKLVDVASVFEALAECRQLPAFPVCQKLEESGRNTSPEEPIDVASSLKAPAESSHPLLTSPARQQNEESEIDTLNGKLIDPASASKELVELHPPHLTLPVRQQHEESGLDPSGEESSSNAHDFLKLHDVLKDLTAEKGKRDQEESSSTGSDSSSSESSTNPEPKWRSQKKVEVKERFSHYQVEGGTSASNRHTAGFSVDDAELESEITVKKEPEILQPVSHEIPPVHGRGEAMNNPFTPTPVPLHKTLTIKYRHMIGLVEDDSIPKVISSLHGRPALPMPEDLTSIHTSIPSHEIQQHQVGATPQAVPPLVPPPVPSHRTLTTKNRHMADLNRNKAISEDLSTLRNRIPIPTGPIQQRQTEIPSTSPTTRLHRANTKKYYSVESWKQALQLKSEEEKKEHRRMMGLGDDEPVPGNTVLTQAPDALHQTQQPHMGVSATPPPVPLHRANTKKYYSLDALREGIQQKPEESKDPVSFQKAEKFEKAVPSTLPPIPPHRANTKKYDSTNPRADQSKLEESKAPAYTQLPLTTHIQQQRGIGGSRLPIPGQRREESQAPTRAPTITRREESQPQRTPTITQPPRSILRSSTFNRDSRTKQEQDLLRSRPLPSTPVRTPTGTRRVPYNDEPEYEQLKRKPTITRNETIKEDLESPRPLPPLPDTVPKINEGQDIMKDEIQKAGAKTEEAISTPDQQQPLTRSNTASRGLTRVNSIRGPRPQKVRPLSERNEARERKMARASTRHPGSTSPIKQDQDLFRNSIVTSSTPTAASSAFGSHRQSTNYGTTTTTTTTTTSSSSSSCEHRETFISRSDLAVKMASYTITSSPSPSPTKQDPICPTSSIISSNFSTTEISGRSNLKSPEPSPAHQTPISPLMSSKFSTTEISGRLMPKSPEPQLSPTRQTSVLHSPAGLMSQKFGALGLGCSSPSPTKQMLTDFSMPPSRAMSPEKQDFSHGRFNTPVRQGSPEKVDLGRYDSVARDRSPVKGMFLGAVGPEEREVREGSAKPKIRSLKEDGDWMRLTKENKVEVVKDETPGEAVKRKSVFAERVKMLDSERK